MLDFYCPASSLAIELDGDTHAGRTTRDAVRTRFLKARGIRVIRFANRDVWSNLEGVKETIALTLGLQA